VLVETQWVVIHVAYYGLVFEAWRERTVMSKLHFSFRFRVDVIDSVLDLKVLNGSTHWDEIINLITGHKVDVGICLGVNTYIRYSSLRSLVQGIA
jgi:hypothetical protein